MKCFIEALAVLLTAVPLQACPMCKDALEKVTGLAQGFYWGILLMLGVPLLVVSVVTGILIKAYRRPKG